MSTTAQSRDLSDPTTIESFAAVVQTLERLKLLMVLTIADIKAVGPGVWTGWKGELLRTLYYETEVCSRGAIRRSSAAERVRLAQTACARGLPIGRRANSRPMPGATTPPIGCGAARSKVRHAISSGRRSNGRTAAGDGDRDRRFRGVTTLTSVRARPSASLVPRLRRLRHGGRQYRRCADLHHERRARHRHDLDLARLRAGRRRIAPAGGWRKRSSSSSKGATASPISGSMPRPERRAPRLSTSPRR